MFDRCVQDLVRFVHVIGEPWFLSFRHPDSLLDRSDSPLRDEDKARLREALAGNASTDNIHLTRKQLGLKLGAG